MKSLKWKLSHRVCFSSAHLAMATLASFTPFKGALEHLEMTFGKAVAHLK